MEARGDAGDSSFTGSAQKIALELDGGEVIGSPGQIGKSPVATGCICQGNDDRSMQVSIGRKQLGAQHEAAGEAPRLQAEELDS